MENIQESSLSRVWKHFSDENTTVVIFTAFRDGVAYKKCVQKNRKFAAELKNAGFGYFFVDGYFPENEGTEDEIQVKEDSIFAIAEGPNESRKLIDLCHKLANSENQDSIIVKELNKGIYFLDQKEGKFNLEKGKVTFKEVGKYYTKLRNKKASNLFVFEGTHTRPGFFQSFKNYLEESYNEDLKESSLSRIYSQVIKHNSGTISAFRSAKDCNNGDIYTTKENKDNSAILKAKLLKKGYGVTKIKGTYIENYKSDNEIEVQEDSYMVIDLSDKGTLKKDLIELGTLFEQDSITYQEKDGNYYLISTNECPEGYPGFGKIGKELKLGKTIYGKKGEFHSKINGRPFVFENIGDRTETLLSKSIGEIRSITEFAKLK
jgi:hypothetical protein